MQIQLALIICRLFICEFVYMQLKNGLISGTYPLIYSDRWSLCMRIHYMRAYFWSPYLSHITRSTCTAIYFEMFLHLHTHYGRTDKEVQLLTETEKLILNREYNIVENMVLTEHTLNNSKIYVLNLYSIIKIIMSALPY